MTPKETKVWRGQEAERLKNDSTLNMALNAIEDRAIEDMIRCQFWQHRKRAGLAEKVIAVRSLRQELVSMVQTGKDSQ